MGEDLKGEEEEIALRKINIKLKREGKYERAEKKRGGECGDRGERRGEEERRRGQERGGDQQFFKDFCLFAPSVSSRSFFSSKDSSDLDPPHFPSVSRR